MPEYIMQVKNTFINASSLNDESGASARPARQTSAPARVSEDREAGREVCKAVKRRGDEDDLEDQLSEPDGSSLHDGADCDRYSSASDDLQAAGKINPSDSDAPGMQWYNSPMQHFWPQSPYTDGDTAFMESSFRPTSQSGLELEHYHMAQQDFGFEYSSQQALGDAYGNSKPGGELQKSADGLNEWYGKTTAMVRNVPFEFTYEMLKEEVNNAGFTNQFDFMYLPLASSSQNKGYAFINFVNSATAHRFKEVCEVRKLRDRKVHVTPANLQGYAQNVEHAAVNKGIRLNQRACSSMTRQGLPDQREFGARRGGYSKQNAAGSIGTNAPSYGGRGMQTQHDHLPQRSESAAAKGSKARIAPSGKSSLHLATRRFCSYCGGVALKSARFCLMCGSKLPQF
eukprot:TRINITY_DN66837_c0_g1_i1.p1 TRINITY_DN66837_c0_g1~~TRINITY_DN66837_c0_g1_i1.p1  ORF type:complete len:421 (+),score=49.98 TRINITY_DN66837_c0_g1_i1:69-1265(+)